MNERVWNTEKLGINLEKSERKNAQKMISLEALHNIMLKALLNFVKKRFIFIYLFLNITHSGPV